MIIAKIIALLATGGAYLWLDSIDREGLGALVVAVVAVAFVVAGWA